eukprot:CAMPEP_0179347748 /NCGR_PEP_ID=MMETSP0797-20121207/73317_1 /TAXON_ID=47934 /ORGANISM="Dinophysis acuminata, Strain DAEP01" /LENGTH=52 /DNA_ID=CAMNT_0021062473 /DNA_START=85 /DNA_END=240 /DNA_ORIENTATION=-
MAGGGACSDWRHMVAASMRTMSYLGSASNGKYTLHSAPIRAEQLGKLKSCSK